MHPEEGKVSIFFPALCTCVETTRRQNFHRRSPVGRRTKRQFPFYTHVCSETFFLSLPRRLSSCKQKAAFSLCRVTIRRKGKRCVPGKNVFQRWYLYKSSTFLLLLFFPPLQLLFVLGCMCATAAFVCMACGGFFSDKRRTKFKTKITSIRVRSVWVGALWRAHHYEKQSLPQPFSSAVQVKVNLFKWLTCGFSCLFLEKREKSSVFGLCSVNIPTKFFSAHSSWWWLIYCRSSSTKILSLLSHLERDNEVTSYANQFYHFHPTVAWIPN